MVTYTFTSILPDPWLFIADLFSKWIRVKILMVFALTWSIVCLGMSIWLGMSYDGDLGSVTYSDGSSYGGTDWTTGVCDASPYIFLRPFAFTYSKPNGYTSSTQTTCGFPSTNSIIRYVISGGGLVATALLFFKTPVSVIARQIWAALGFLYLVVFILDANDTENGITACKDGFANTNLQTDFDSKGITLSCDNSNYAGLAVIDLILCVTFFLLHSAWALTKDLYVVKK